ncbi:MAG: hypothetical protein BWY36_00888 [Candidatus Diapherotrites archaeon ADurb.Bin253]|jgi:hypothetical protein|nr:MAG: hypothetical protein BWY36_00888 [Candidatus Diapherotrites archaeon ADurb.Bin253]HOF44338.1 hypothetical protein [Candidatus Pacearchaeota archaeon]HOR52744.1 hypothetical protein [Candidatus Pacearchaeota archaeon]HOU79612.1 hypothetical protein [Candidatus Pacearchaeota archaeon]HQF83322.1 hypothetical protein [Candidatus Pacearchaeota archaeon]
MTKRNFFTKFMNFIGWLTGVVVSLAVGFGMVDGVLSIKFIPDIVMKIFGWIVIVTTLIGVFIGIMKLFSKSN